MRAFVLIAAWLWSAAAAAQSSVAAPHVTVSLAAERTAVTPGAPLALGLHFALEEHWHVYWVNPGDSGEAPGVTWTLPPGYAAGEILWPVPKRIVTGPLVNLGYEHEVLLPVTVATPAGAVGPARVEAAVTWLVCREDCIPGKARLSLDLPVGEGAPNARWAPLFTRNRAAAPVPADATLTDEGSHLSLALPGGAVSGASYVFHPRAPDVVELAAPQVAAIEADTVRLRLKKGPQAPPRLGALRGLVVATTADGSSAVEVDARPNRSRPPLGTTARAGAEGAGAGATSGAGAERGSAGTSASSGEPGGGSVTARSGGLGGAEVAAAAGPVRGQDATHSGGPADTEPLLALGWALLFAFLGGLLLNLMPCVFPVLSLKVLSFVEQARSDRSQVRRHGLVFGAGVLLSFWILAGILMALRAAGQHLGWGFQLQSPVFLVVIAALLFLLALSLSGVFEVGLSLTTLGGLGSGGGYAGSFVTGALATVVATPCTAPFMGPALGYALTQPPASGLLVFTALAAGMAGPYVVLAWWPAALARLPRPGPWMVTFKQAMAFPLYATVLWLLAVLGLQVGVLPLVEVMGALLGLAFAAWLRMRLDGRGRWLLLAPAIAVLALVVAVRAADRAPPTSTAAAAPGDLWSPWSPERVDTLRAAGTPVFVNFTAAWCLSCKVNERLVFSTDEVKADFAAAGVVPLLADWTKRDDLIARTLESFGRQGVPLYVYYPPGGAPRVLPPVLTRDMLAAAIAAP